VKRNFCPLWSWDGVFSSICMNFNENFTIFIRFHFTTPLQDYVKQWNSYSLSGKTISRFKRKRIATLLAKIPTVFPSSMRIQLCYHTLIPFINARWTESSFIWIYYWLWWSTSQHIRTTKESQFLMKVVICNVHSICNHFGRISTLQQRLWYAMSFSIWNNIGRISTLQQRYFVLKIEETIVPKTTVS